ncbi:MAG: hypothetical protein H7A47_02175 [Verrucomicrobiales bacterium]|nr:hypothetical protein [Verrucomicrobiales bacterium]
MNLSLYPETPGARVTGLLLALSNYEPVTLSQRRFSPMAAHQGTSQTIASNPVPKGAEQDSPM